jgi:hypothetical protein
MNPADGLKDMSCGILKEFQAGKRQVIMENGNEFLMILVSEF